MLCMYCVFVFGVPPFIIAYAPVLFFVISFNSPVGNASFNQFLVCTGAYF
jgi:hypothetical protein